MFTDIAKIVIKAGDGGNGCTSFYTEKYISNGGPDGGDGGKGGDVYIESSASLATLTDFKFTRVYKAGDGANGSPKHCHGKKGKDITIKVPCGTVVRDKETGNIIADMFYDGQIIKVLSGGDGGKGNARFATSRRQAPHFSQTGQTTQSVEITLELKLIADVGLVGFPNVGKSTLLSVVSRATPKIGDYHFTTLSPNLGTVTRYEESFVIADIPGLIEGAGSGAGLGTEFLRHVDRTRLIVHVIDIAAVESRDPIDDYKKIRAELKAYNKQLSMLPEIIALNKCDLPSAKENAKKFKSVIKAETVEISAATHGGIDELLNKIYAKLKTLPPRTPMEYEPFVYEREDPRKYRIERHNDGAFAVVGPFVDELARDVVLDDYESFTYFQRRLVDAGVIKALKKAGMVEGSTVRIKDVEFEYVE